MPTTHKRGQALPASIDQLDIHWVHGLLEEARNDPEFATARVAKKLMVTMSWPDASKLMATLGLNVNAALAKGRQMDLIPDVVLVGSHGIGMGQYSTRWISA